MSLAQSIDQTAISGAKGGYDAQLLAGVLFLVGFGIVMVYSASFEFAAARFGNGQHFLYRQIIYAGMGLLAMIVLMRVDYHKFYGKTVAYGLLVLVGLLLILVLIPGVSPEINGTHRWLKLGPISLQPAELAKFAVVIFLANGILFKKGKMKSFWFGFLPHLVIPGALIFLIVLEPDFGGAALILGVCLIMLYVGGAWLPHLLGALFLAAAGAGALIVVSPYRVSRIMTFIDPWPVKYGAGYQIIQSLTAFGSGGLFGRGLGEGRQKLHFLPELHTDFILANIGEELGFFGVAALLGLLAFITWRGLRIAYRAADPFGAYLGFGLVLMLGLQMVLNVGVVLAMLPTKGMTLPLVSYGGSSLIVSLSMLGLLLSISSRGRQPNSARDERSAKPLFSGRFKTAARGVSYVR